MSPSHRKSSQRLLAPGAGAPMLAEALRRAIVFHQRGNLAEAERHCKGVLGAKADHFDALHLLGVVHAQQGRLEEAHQLLAKALRINPRSAEAYSNQANVLKTLRRFEEALASCDRALALKPDFAEALSNRGAALKDLKRYEEALASFDRALALKPGLAEVLNNRGAALNDLERYEEALASFDRALELSPNFADGLNNRGVALKDLNRYAEALASFDQALAIRPDFDKALHNRGVVLSILGRYEDAAKELERALDLNRELPFAAGVLLHSRMHCCNWWGHDAQASRLVADVRAGNPRFEPFGFLGISSSAEDQLICAQTWVRDRHPASPKPLWHGERYCHKRIRLAYLSADFREHPLGHLMAGLFERHDRERFETIAVSFGPYAPSAMRSRLEDAFEQFIDVQQKSDSEVADLLRELEIDILVDRNGYTTGSRPGVFALRPAPIQVNYLAYPGTMGAEYIDYIVADEVVIPPEQQGFYTEKVVYLPDTYQANDSKRRIAERTPTRAEAGLPETGFVFCSFNNNYKITPAVFDVWMRLLRQVEGSVLWLLAGDPAASRNLRREAADRGIAPERLVFAPKIKHADHLARQRLADLFLDTLPCNAHTTASDALWAGLPVLTCCGTTFAGRVAGSLLHAIGLPELITHSLDEYESLALRLARDATRHAGIKAKLARNRDRYPLFDTDRFRRHLEAAYVEMWERFQRGEPPAGFAVASIA